MKAACDLIKEAVKANGGTIDYEGKASWAIKWESQPGYFACTIFGKLLLVAVGDAVVDEEEMERLRNQADVRNAQ